MAVGFRAGRVRVSGGSAGWRWGVTVGGGELGTGLARIRACGLGEANPLCHIYVTYI